MCCLTFWNKSQYMYTRDLKIKFVSVGQNHYQAQLLSMCSALSGSNDRLGSSRLGAHIQSQYEFQVQVFSEVNIKNCSLQRDLHFHLHLVSRLVWFINSTRYLPNPYSRRQHLCIQWAVEAFARRLADEKPSHLSNPLRLQKSNQLTKIKAMRLSEKFRLRFYCCKLPIVSRIMWQYLMFPLISLRQIWMMCKPI